MLIIGDYRKTCKLSNFGSQLDPYQLPWTLAITKSLTNFVKQWQLQQLQLQH